MRAWVKRDEREGELKPSAWLNRVIFQKPLILLFSDNPTNPNHSPPLLSQGSLCVCFFSIAAVHCTTRCHQQERHRVRCRKQSQLLPLPVVALSWVTTFPGTRPQRTKRKIKRENWIEKNKGIKNKRTLVAENATTFGSNGKREFCIFSFGWKCRTGVIFFIAEC